MNTIYHFIRKFLLIGIFSLMVSNVTAFDENAQYQIIKLSTPTINIGGKTLKKGDVFPGKDKPKWVDDKQSMVVKQIGKGKGAGNLYEFSKKVMESKGSTSIADFFLRTSMASSRDVNNSFSLKQSPVANEFPEKRIALVIGNSNYLNVNYLRNAQNDALAISNLLQTLGFDVIEAYETNYDEMKTALNRFSGLARDYDVALFYFAGHGLQEDGKNYLIPINAELEFRSELSRFLQGDDVVERLASTGATTQLIFIDACRNAKTNWSRGTTEGLARMEGGPGAVIVFSTESGKVALDGDGDNSPFAESLLKHLPTDASFPEMMNSVVNDTYESTNHRQYPLIIGTPRTKFYFNPRPVMDIKKAGSEDVISPISAPENVKADENTSKSVTQTDIVNEMLKKGMEYYDKEYFLDALEYFLKVAEYGNPQAENNIGVMYFLGQGVRRDYSEAMKWYLKAAEKGYAEAQNNIGVLYENGQGVKQDFSQAKKWYMKAAEQGSAMSQYNIGAMYNHGRGVKQDYAEARKWYLKAAEQGFDLAQYNLGVLYNYGEGVRQNFAEAMNWYMKAAEQGYADAQTNIGVMYNLGQGVRQDYAEAMKWYLKAAEQGYAEAQSNIGIMYYLGQGVKQNYSEALKWYLKAAEQGFAMSQYNVGAMYNHGQGVRQDYSEALKWYMKAAEQGFALAQYNIGVMYNYGEGVRQDYSEALKWYLKAAEQGNAEAENNIGVLYENGQGVPLSYMEAAKWYKRASANGFKKAEENYERVTRGDEPRIYAPGSPSK